jgi:hypothetical protein
MGVRCSGKAGVLLWLGRGEEGVITFINMTRNVNSAILTIHPKRVSISIMIWRSLDVMIGYSTEMKRVFPLYLFVTTYPGHANRVYTHQGSKNVKLKKWKTLKRHRGTQSDNHRAFREKPATRS